MTSASQTSPRWSTWLPGLGLLALVFCAYLPVLPGTLLMDDQRLVSSDNPLVNGEFTPGNIWFQTDFTLSSFTFWLEYLAWGLQPGGYHAVNILLHAVSAILLWRILRALNLPGAWLAGALFALHPVAVNSVARVAELKNTLSLVLLLTSLRAWLRYEDVALYPAPAAARPARWAGLVWYQTALLTFLLSLLAKTSGVMLPLVILALAGWRRGRITGKDVVHQLPFFVLSAALGGMSIWFQKHQALAEAGQTLAPTSFAYRLATAGKVFWFYLGKDLVPLHLNLVYPAWKTDPQMLMAWWPWAGIVLLFVACGWFWRSWGRAGGIALGCFGLTLFPVLGFFASQFLVRWQVADHLQYLPLLFPVVLVAAALGAGLPARWFPAVATLLVAGMLALTWQRATAFATEENLMRDTLAGNPAAAAAHDDLGGILARHQDIAGALEEFRTATRLEPDNPAFLQNLGQACLLTGQPAEAETHYRAALAANHANPVLHEQYGQLLARTGRPQEAIRQYQAAIIFQTKTVPLRLRTQLAGLYYQTGHFRRATALLRLAIQANPPAAEARNNLAWMLATCGDERVRDGQEAVRQATAACEAGGGTNATFLSTLAVAEAAAGRYTEAVDNAEKAISLQAAAGEVQPAAMNRQLLSLYQSGQPYHEPTAVDADGD